MKKNERQKQVEERYNLAWEPYKSDLSRIKAIVDLAGTQKNVLDIGCYDGTIGSALLRNGNKVSGIDFSKEAVNFARQKGIDAYQADIEEDAVPFKEHSFDVIVFAEIIEHVFDTDAFLEKIKKYLTKEGQIVLTTPNLATLGRRLMLLCGKNPLIEVSCHNGAAGHIRYFVKESLFGLLKAHGFRIEVFTSDVINFTNSGKVFLRWPARMFPTLGKSLIVRARLVNEKA